MLPSFDQTLVLRDASELSELADVLEPESDPAFADTIHVRGLPPDEPAPPSGPVIVNDPTGGPQLLTALAFPLPSDRGGEVDPKGDTLAMILPPGPLEGIRHAIRSSVDEISELWAGTAEVVSPLPGERPRIRAVTLMRRARALWSFWEWDSTDVLRAAMIGIAVFLAAACIGASTFATSTASMTDDARSAAEVRGPRTLDQHTAKRVVVRVKAPRSR
jgi:hypothetical protein